MNYQTKIKQGKQPDDKIKKESYDKLPMVKTNFIVLAISAALIVLGFLLMLGSGASKDHFNADIFSVRRIVIAPTICFIGFVGVAVAIIIRPKEKTKYNETQN